MKRDEYEKYLRSEPWQELRLKALQRAGGRCQTCNVPSATSSLDVHHRTYKNVGKESLEDLTVLCRACHTVIHNVVGLHGEMAPKEPETTESDLLGIIRSLLQRTRFQPFSGPGSDRYSSMREDACQGYANGDILADMAMYKPTEHAAATSRYEREQEHRRQIRKAIEDQRSGG